MHSIGRIVVSLAVTLIVGSGCTFGWMPRDAHDPTFAAVPPCLNGAVCAVAFDNGGFRWTRDVMQSARH